MSRPETLTAALTAALGEQLASVRTELGEVTAVVRAGDLLPAARTLRDAPELAFEQLTDLCGVDYSAYGGAWDGARYAVVYQLLSLRHNVRLIRRRITAVESCAVAPDGTWLVTTSADRTARSGP